MSLEAFVWASGLPMDICSNSDYRVLLVLANHAHKDGSNAFRNASGIAVDLGCSERTVQRAFRSLETRGLITRGDPRLVDHIRHDRRPVVWDLNLRFAVASTVPQTLDGTTTDDVPHGTTDLSRYDRSGSDGTTTAVALRTKDEPSKKSSRDNHTATVAPCGHALVDDRHCIRGCAPIEVVA